MTKFILFFLIVFLLCIFLYLGRYSPKISANNEFKIDKYLGKWYEIKRYNHKFEKGLKNVQAEYSFIEPGKVKVLNTGINNLGEKKEFHAIAKVHNAPNFFRVYPESFSLVSGRYNVAWIDDNYQYAIVTSGSYNYLWFLSRKKEIPNDIYQEMISFVEKLGYDTSKLIDGQ